MPAREPAWWSDARRMSAAGMTAPAIAKALGYSAWGVRYAISDKVRRYSCQRKQRNRVSRQAPSTVPFPYWWLEAEVLHRLGCSKKGIGRILGKGDGAVRRALRPDAPPPRQAA